MSVCMYACSDSTAFTVHDVMYDSSRIASPAKLSQVSFRSYIIQLSFNP